MPGNNQSFDRRAVLKTLGGTAVGLAVTADTTGAAEADDAIPHESLRGTVQNPIPTDQIETVRDRFVKKHTSRGGRKRSAENGKGPSSGEGKSNHAVLDASATFTDDQILGYNILLDGDDNPREQYVSRGSGDARAEMTAVSGRSINKRFQKKADGLLTEAVDDLRSSTDSVSTMSTDEVDWNNWWTIGSTDIYHEFAPDREYDTRPGAVKFVNDVRRSPDHPRIGARSKVRMEPGRQLCNDGFDEYCTPTMQDGWRNRSATVNHDWDQAVNETSTEDLIIGTDPEGQISDVTTTRGVSIGLEIAREPSLSVGYNSSVTLPGAQLVDKTSLMSGRSEHEFSINSSVSTSAKNTAVFEVGSVAEYQTDCGGRPSWPKVLDIDVDLAWGLDVHGYWVNKTTDSKSFDYYTYC